jgi:hypothetical protein
LGHGRVQKCQISCAGGFELHFNDKCNILFKPKFAFFADLTKKAAQIIKKFARALA